MQKYKTNALGNATILLRLSLAAPIEFLRWSLVGFGIHLDQPRDWMGFSEILYVLWLGYRRLGHALPRAFSRVPKANQINAQERETPKLDRIQVFSASKLIKETLFYFAPNS